MTKNEVMRIVLLSIFGISYLVFTIWYFFRLRKTILFSPGVKVFHLVMIWLVPFVWALLLMGLSQSAPGSYEIEKKEDPEPYSKNGGRMWTG